MTESELSRYAKDRLLWSGLVFWRVNNAPSLFSSNNKVGFRKSPVSGFPDWAGVTKTGQFWAIELKTKIGRLAIHQKAWIDKLNASGCRAVVCRNQGEIDSFIEQLGGQKKIIAESGNIMPTMGAAPTTYKKKETKAIAKVPNKVLNYFKGDRRIY